MPSPGHTTCLYTHKLSEVIEGSQNMKRQSYRSQGLFPTSVFRKGNDVQDVKDINMFYYMADD